MLISLQGKICDIIALARLARQEEEHQNIRTFTKLVTNTRPTPHNDQFQEIVNQLSREERDELVAIMWLGQENHDIAEFNHLLRKAQEFQEIATEYITGFANLANDLQNGLKKLGITCP